MCDEEDYTHTQTAKLLTQLDSIETQKRFGSLHELLYTASETGILDDSVSVEDALTIWKLVELAKSFGDNLPNELRM